MGYVKPTLTEQDLDAMSCFLDMARGRVLPSSEWGGRPVPQGVSVFIRNGSGTFEYLFTKDEKYTGRVDYHRTLEEFDFKGEIFTPLYSYVRPDDYEPVYYMNRDAVAIVSKHRRLSEGRASNAIA